MLALLLPLLAPPLAAVPQEPVPPRPVQEDAEARAALEAAWQRWAALPAVDLSLGMAVQFGEQPAVGLGSIAGRIARPASGMLEMTLLSTDEQGRRVRLRAAAVGTGEGIWQVDHRGRYARRSGANWRDGGLPYGLPLEAWAGAPLPDAMGVVFLSPREGREAWTGLAFDTRAARHELWIDAEGRWRESTVRGDAEMVTTTSVTRFEPLAAKEVAVAAVPEDYARLDDALYPDADPPALAYLQAFERRCAEAAALHFTAVGTLEGPQSRGDMRIECAVARPALGRFVAEAVLHSADAPEGAPPLEKRGTYVGDGERVQVTLGEETYTADAWRDAEVGEGVLPFAIWAGIDAGPRTGVGFAEPDPEHPGRVGIRYRAKEGSMHTLWFDADGNWVGLRVEEGVDAQATVLRMDIRGFRLRKEIDPRDYGKPDAGDGR